MTTPPVITAKATTAMATFSRAVGEPRPWMVGLLPRSSRPPVLLESPGPWLPAPCSPSPIRSCAGRSGIAPQWGERGEAGFHPPRRPKAIDEPTKRGRNASPTNGSACPTEGRRRPFRFPVCEPAPVKQPAARPMSGTATRSPARRRPRPLRQPRSHHRPVARAATAGSGPPRPPDSRTVWPPARRALTGIGPGPATPPGAVHRAGDPGMAELPRLKGAPAGPAGDGGNLREDRLGPLPAGPVRRRPADGGDRHHGCADHERHDQH